MPKFSRKSHDILKHAHPLLVDIFKEVVKRHDCSPICSHRTRERQDKVFAKGNSQVEWPNSKHNSQPSMAIDVVPYPPHWDDINQFRVMSEYALGVAVGVLAHTGYKLIWGGDWDNDGRTDDQTFNDLAHFELRIA